MQHHHQHVLTRPGPQQPRPHRNLHRQVKRLPGQLRQKARQIRLRHLSHRQRHRHLAHPQDPLIRLPVRDREHRPQHLMPAKDVRQRRAQ